MRLRREPSITTAALLWAVLVVVPTAIVGRQSDDVAEQYRTVRKDVLQTTLAKHILILLGGNGADAASSPKRGELGVLSRSLEDAHRAVVQVHGQRRPEIEALIGRPVKPRFSSTIGVVAAAESRADTDVTGRIRLSSGFLRSQIEALLAEATDNDAERRAFTSAVQTFEDTSSFARFHAIHERKWKNGFEDAGVMIVLSDFVYRGGLRFVVAHEVGHLALGHFERALDCKSRQAAELEADRYGAAVIGVDLSLGSRQYENPAADVLRGLQDAGGFGFFFLSGYPKAFVPESGGTCPIYAPADERAKLLETVAESAAEKYAIPQIIERYRTQFEGYAPGVTAAVIKACGISDGEAIEKIAGTIDAIRGLYGRIDLKLIVESIRERIGKGDKPDCERSYLFD